MTIKNVFELEKYIQDFWKDNDIINKVLSKKGNLGSYYFLDGPPYATARIHIGTAWNKILKDSILRYKRMKGYDVWIKPGYDTHGLPIEVMVEKKLDLKRKQEIINTIGIKKFNELCRNYADQFVTVLNNQFKSLAVWMDGNNPYLT